MIASFLSGDVEVALELERVLLDSFVYETSDEAPNPVPTKAMLRVLGLPAGQCRLPMGEAPAHLEDRAKVILGELEHWRAERALRG